MDMRGRSDLACSYLFGRGVDQSYEMASRLFSELAEEGVADAQYDLGVMYFEGKGVPQSYDGAARLFRMASESDRASARSMLSEMYDKDLI